MKRLIALAMLFAAPAYADEVKSVWVMTVQLKSTTLTTTYQTEDKCRDAVKLIAPHVKKLGRADCLPVLQQ